jgi:hypothetical protein
MTDPAVFRLDGAWTVRREAEPPPLPREMKVGGRVWVWGVGCEGDERAEKRIAGRGAVPIRGRATDGQSQGSAKFLRTKFCSPFHSF